MLDKIIFLDFDSHRNETEFVFLLFILIIKAAFIQKPKGSSKISLI